jgi:hypothetical protein
MPGKGFAVFSFDALLALAGGQTQGGYFASVF